MNLSMAEYLQLYLNTRGGKATFWMVCALRMGVKVCFIVDVAIHLMRQQEELKVTECSAALRPSEMQSL